MNMSNGQTMDLCLALLQADTEDEVIALLKKASLWDSPAAGGTTETMS